MLPNDPIILLTTVDTQLPYDDADRDDPCGALDITPGELCGRLAPLGYTYNRKANRFQ